MKDGFARFWGIVLRLGLAAPLNRSFTVYRMTSAFAFRFKIEIGGAFE